MASEQSDTREVVAEDIPPYVEGVLGVRQGASDDFVAALSRRFVAKVVLHAPGAHVHGSGPALYMANHQTGIESFLFCCLVSALRGGTAAGLAKAEHASSWFGRVLECTRSHPDVGHRVPGMIFVQRGDSASLVQALAEVTEALDQGISVLMHVEGTRAWREDHAVRRFHPALFGPALRAGVPVVPVRFRFGLPVTPSRRRFEFPADYGRQVYHVGAPIPPDRLACLDPREQVRSVATAINLLGDGDPVPPAGDPAFARAVADWSAATGVAAEYAAVLCALRDFGPKSADGRAALDLAMGRPTPLPAGERGAWIRDVAALLGGSALRPLAPP